MKPKKKKGYFSFGLASLVLVIVDWYCQYYFRILDKGVSNTGISFGLGSSWGNAWPVVILFALLILVAYFLLKRGGKLSVFYLVLFIGGLGNLIPRILYGSVWDYINVPAVGLWINLSDILISTTLVSYILTADES